MADLRKIGVEGFALIDKFYGPSRRRRANDAFGIVQVPSGGREPAINSEEAAMHYGGVMVINYPKGKPPKRWGRPIKP